MEQLLIVEDDIGLNQGLCKALKVDDRYSFPPPGICCASGCRNDAPTAQNHADLRGVVLRNVFRSGGLCAFTGGGTSCGENAGQYVLVL